MLADHELDYIEKRLDRGLPDWMGGGESVYAKEFMAHARLLLAEVKRLRSEGEP